jgi:hypothetical protein
LPLAVGALSLAVGVLAGGIFAWDAIRFWDSGLLVMASVVFVGAGLDLALEILVPGRTGRVAMEVRLEKGRRLRLTGAPIEDADRFLKALASYLAGV